MEHRPHLRSAARDSICRQQKDKWTPAARNARAASRAPCRRTRPQTDSADAPARARASNRGYIAHHIKPRIGDVPLEKLIALDLQKLY
ncbi:MAG: hypothetical protein E7422_09280 [Ruminococcaceae bacterium]|nr:hypothetical protein [Oscillospiraceae bacterium]